jgi:Uma2 family endonuclease
MVTLQLHQISVPAGNRIVIKDVGWQEFEAILEELGESRATRLAYSEGTLEIRRLSTHQERKKAIAGDLIKILLEELEMDCECFGSTTFKRGNKASVEPGNCFYIQNQAQMIGNRDIDLSVDPPPDLAIEVDSISEIQSDAYQSIGVPELWLYEKGKLRINRLLTDDGYVEIDESPTFPNISKFMVAAYIEQALGSGRSILLSAFRKWVQEHRNSL